MPKTLPLMRDMEVDVAVDLGRLHRRFPHRCVCLSPCAPVQVNYLGYPGTMGTTYMDYIIADRFGDSGRTPAILHEKVVYLPTPICPARHWFADCRHHAHSPECGLPDEGVVFCSFSHDYKISRPVVQRVDAFAAASARQ